MTSTALVPFQPPAVGLQTALLNATDEALIEAFMASPRQAPLNTRHRRERALRQWPASSAAPGVGARVSPAVPRPRKTSVGDDSTRPRATAQS